VTYTTVISPQALEDIEKAYRWLLQQTSQHAPIWHDGLIDALLSLEENPERCPIEDPAEESRYLLYGDKRHAYRVVFEIRGRQVWISSVRHAARRR
jgi:plasmid stabilization system protein ParE